MPSRAAIATVPTIGAMKVATHSGSFHADDVFALATLALLGDPLEVVRTRDPKVMAACDARIDVGFRSDPATGDFDHHQREGAGARPNGIRYASFGLVWREYGARLCDGDAAVAERVDRSLVQAVDANDTGQAVAAPGLDGGRPMTVSGGIGSPDPTGGGGPNPGGGGAPLGGGGARAARGPRGGG